MTRPLIVIVGLLLVVPGGASAYDALLLDPDEDRIVGEPDVAIADDGSTVVVWASHVAEGAQPLNGIRIRRFDAAGQAFGEVFRIDVLPGDLARKPSVDITPDGSRVVVAWEGGTEGKRNKRRIWVQVFDAGGLPVDEEIRVDQRRMTHEQWGLPRNYYRDPKVSIAPSGEFVVVWRTEGKTSCDRFNISARRFNRSGLPLGDEFIVNTERRWSQLNPDVDHDAAGGFVVVWQSGRWIGTNDEVSIIRGRVFGADGKSINRPFQISDGDRRRCAAFPSLSVASGGGFACAWKAGSGAEPLNVIEAQFLDRRGSAVGGPIVVEPSESGRGGPEIEFLEGGSLLLAWEGATGDVVRFPAVVAQVFDTNGRATSDVVPLSPLTCWNVSSPALSGASRGDGAVVWMSDMDDGIFVRRFSGSAPWRDLPLAGGGSRFSEMISAARRVLADSKSDRSERDHARERVFCLGGAAYPLSIALEHCHPSSEFGFSEGMRRECVLALSSNPKFPDRIVPSIRSLLDFRGSDPTVMAGAACALGLFGDHGRPVVSSLLRALESDDMAVVGCAGWSLGRIGAYEAVEPVIAALLHGATESQPLLMHRMLIGGLAELAQDDRAVWALERYWNACGWLDSYVEATGRPRSELDLERYIRYHLHEHKVDDPRMINWSIDEALYRIEEGWVDSDGYKQGLRYREDYDDVDLALTRYAGMRNLGGTTLCDGGAALARGIAELERPSGWAIELYAHLLWKFQSSPCLKDLLAIAEGMGSKGAPLADIIAKSMQGDREYRKEALQALVATDPGCESCIDVLTWYLQIGDSKGRLAAIRALMAAGPSAIQASRNQLTLMLEDDSTVIRDLAERALDLIEVEAEVCDRNWRSISVPVEEPSPPPGSAMPPRAVRTQPPGGAGSVGYVYSKTKIPE